MHTVADASSTKLPPEIVLLQNGHPELAIPMFDEKLGKSPNNWEHHINIGIGYRLVGRYLLALLHQKMATQIRPDSAAAWHNLAVTQTEIGSFDEAFLSAREAHRLLPHNAQTCLSMACALMREGKIHLAWPLWEEARYRSTFAEFPGIRLWTGEEDLRGKRVLVMREGGFGDSIMFLRWFPDLIERGAIVYFQCWDEQLELFKGNPWVPFLIPHSQAIAGRDFDFCVSLLSLPALLNCQPEQIPCAEHYIEANPKYIEKFASYRANKKSFFGICWGAEEKGSQKITRTIPDGELQPYCFTNWMQYSQEPLRTNFGSRNWVSLWPGHGLSWTHPPLSTWQGWHMTAGLIANLEAVVTADTAIAHLAGAMGKPTYLILPAGSDWRWFRDTRPRVEGETLPIETSVWYPSMKIFRSRNPGTFVDAIDAVLTEINAGS
jgi:hypothetical protein